MATLTKTDIGTTWVEIVADLSLSNAVTYILQNVSPYPMLIKEKGSAPGASDIGHIVGSGITWTFTVGSDGVYVRNQGSDNDKKVSIAVTNTN